MTTVLLIGGSGQLGTALEAEFSQICDVRSTAVSHPRSGQVVLDLADRRAVSELLDQVRPDVVLVAGAMCQVDRCEQEPDRCRRINVDGPGEVAAWASRVGARVVFFSTDHVFDGAQDVYAEDDAVHPLSVYAQTKVEAEDALRALVPDTHLILRTGWVYGPDPQRRNFVLRLIDRLQQGETVEVPRDQVGSPTYTEDLARATRFLLESGAGGTFHATGPETLDRATLALRVCEHFGVDPAGVRPRLTADLGQVARRSLRVVLDCRRLLAAGVPAFRGIRAGLDALAADVATRGGAHV
jgi:dTDP-4-dehydrorhamnose reductase